MATLSYNSQNNTIRLIGITIYMNHSLVASQVEQTDDVILSLEGRAVYCAVYSDYLNGDNGNAPFGNNVSDTVTALNSFLNHT